MKTGYHAVYVSNYYGAIIDAVKWGFDFVQIDLGVPELFLDEMNDKELTLLGEFARTSGIELTFHSPGDNTSLYADYPLIREGTLAQFELLLKKANILGARHMTFHTGVYPQFKMSADADCEEESGFDIAHAAHYEQVLYENLRRLIRTSGNVLVCLENCHLDEVGMSAAKRLINEGEKLYLTLDIAKAYRKSQLDAHLLEFYTEYKSTIREIHVHDINAAIGRSHQTVGSGFVDFAAFEHFCGCDTYINFEVRPVESAAISRDNLHRIWQWK